MKIQKCILCNCKFEGWGHNPDPLEDSRFRCCGVCNDTRVIPWRLKIISEKQNSWDKLFPKDGSVSEKWDESPEII